MADTVRILGCRGSVPVSGKAFVRYGGATSCVLVRLAGQDVLLDAGTGLLHLPEDLECRELPLLLSHPHADHLLGLPMCPAVMKPGIRLSVWAADRQGLGPEEQLKALIAPPLWPVELGQLPAKFAFHRICGGFSLGPIQVETMEGSHPGGVTLFRLTGSGRSLVYLPDCSVSGEMMDRAAAFARDADLLLCDGQYSPAQWDACSGFGHSTWEMAAALGALSGAKQMRIIHHDPRHTDAILTRAEADIRKRFPNCRFAFEGEEILL